MAIEEIHKHTVFPYIEKHIEFLYSNRKNLERKQKDEKIGINYSLILLSACLIEGKLENDLKELVQHRSKVFNALDVEDFYKRRINGTVMNKLIHLTEDNISRTTGIGNFESLFKLLSYKRTPEKYSNYANWEGITVLFNFRNVLAHGREISAKRILAWWTDNNWQDEFKGGYNAAEKYLIKRKLIKKGVIENRSAEHLFTNKVTDHFYSISKSFLKYHSKLVKQEMKKFTLHNIKGI
jgi:hypothetical protein